MNPEEMEVSQTKYQFNENLLTIYGLMYPNIQSGKTSPICVVEINYTYVLDIMIAFIVIAFSILFIVILYNAFLIAITERKKEYAVLNSVGGTESQILKTILLEGMIISTIAIILGGLISVIFSNAIINNINSLLMELGYKFKLIYDIKYIIFALAIIIINVYIAAVIPSARASTASVIQEIRNNKQIKYKKINGILEKVLPVEGRVAAKNIKRNHNKYIIISMLLVVCMMSYIIISTYITYEKSVSDLVIKYDVDAQLYIEDEQNGLTDNDYKMIINNYENLYGRKVEYIEYQISPQLEIDVKPESNINWDAVSTQNEKDNKKLIHLLLG